MRYNCIIVVIWIMDHIHTVMYMDMIHVYMVIIDHNNAMNWIIA
jgi:hypothetical protein